MQCNRFSRKYSQRREGNTRNEEAESRKEKKMKNRKGLFAGNDLENFVFWKSYFHLFFH